MIEDIITGSIFAFGTMTVVLSLYSCYKFHIFRRALHGDANKLTSAIAWQLFGEAVIGAGTLTFAIAVHFGWLAHWHEYVQSSIRFVMFFATAATTLHLVKRISQ